MVKNICKDIFILQQKAAPATEADKQVVTDLLDTLKANLERCVGMAANMIGIPKSITKFADNTVEFVIAHPGIKWNSVLTGQPRAVVIQGYHSGKRPTANEDFKRFAFMAKAFQIRIFLTGSSAATAYESAAQFEELGIEIIEDMPPIAAYVYVWGE